MENNKKQTAVSWLLDNIISEPYSEEDFEHNKECCIKAKEMGKEQIIGFAEDYELYESDKHPRKSFEQYYSETYEK